MAFGEHMCFYISIMKQEAATRGVLQKNCSSPFLIKLQAKRDSNTGAFLSILQNTSFEEHLRTATSDETFIITSQVTRKLIHSKTNI